MKPLTPQSPITPTVPTRGPLRRAERCDVLVVGSGISGAMAAFHLAEAGADVVVIDKRSLTCGSTALSTALVQYELDVPLLDLSKAIGPADAQAAYRATRSALDDLKMLVEKNNIACQFAAHPTLYLAHDEDAVPRLRLEAAARETMGLDAQFIEAAAVASRYRIASAGAIRSAVSYQLDPRALATQLLSIASERGARLYDHTALEAGSGEAFTRTTEGHEIHADHVVYATGYDLPEWLPELQGLCSFTTTYAVLTKPLAPELLWPERALLWETGTPYFYARTTADQRLLLGGEDDATLDPASQRAALPAVAERLLARLKRLTGITGVEVDQTWAARFAHTPDGLPLIGSPASAPRCSFTLGFGGNGIVFSLIGAQLIRDHLAGKPNPVARLLSFDRARSLQDPTMRCD